jgi:hypothetical protein
MKFSYIETFFHKNKIVLKKMIIFETDLMKDFFHYFFDIQSVNAVRLIKKTFFLSKNVTFFQSFRIYCL